MWGGEVWCTRSANYFCIMEMDLLYIAGTLTL
jgi:hypothetical protein